MKKILSFFSRLGGDPQSVLRNCSEKARIDSSSQGATIILPMFVWGAGGFSTAFMMGAGMLGCCVAAGVLMVVILVCDRGMMSYTSRKERSSIGIVARFGLAFLGSLLFAHPAVFFLARGVIDRELAAEEQASVEERKTEIAPQLQKARERLSKSVRVQEQAATTTQEAYAAKDEELRGVRTEIAKWTRDADAEAKGLRGSPKGEGTDYKRAERYLKEAQAKETALKGELDAARKAMEEAREALASATADGKGDPEIKRLEEDLALALKKVREQDHGGPFSRFEALHHVIAKNWKAGSFALGLAYAVVCLVLLGLEIIPLCLKLGAGGGELALAIDQQQFRAEQDNANYKQVYPALSMEITRHRLQVEAYREKLRLDNELAMDRVRVPAERTRLILIEQAHVFELAEDVLRRGEKSKRPEYRQFTESLAGQLIDAFQRAVYTEMGCKSAGEAGPSDAFAEAA